MAKLHQEKRGENINTRNETWLSGSKFTAPFLCLTHSLTFGCNHSRLDDAHFILTIRRSVASLLTVTATHWPLWRNKWDIFTFVDQHLQGEFELSVVSSLGKRQHWLPLRHLLHLLINNNGPLYRNKEVRNYGFQNETRIYYYMFIK